MNVKHSVGSRMWLQRLLVLSLMSWTYACQAQISPPFTTLYSFSLPNSTGINADGFNPYAGLIQGKDGALYGTTYYGGVNGYGTVFKITTVGALTTLHSFSNADGRSPDGALLQGKDGNLYGTTIGSSPGGGTVFKITTSGALTTLCTFDNFDGAAPIGALVQGTDGNLYGTTSGGGAYGLYGTAFKITTSGALTTLANFDVSIDYPNGLIQGKDGNLYGTADGGGRWGTIFKITASDDFVLDDFDDINGADPWATPIQASDGKLYGTTYTGGAYGEGTVYKVTTFGKLTSLYSFTATSGYPSYSNSDGANPYAGVIQGKDGALYGSTTGGGANGSGTIFRITTSGTLTTLYNFSAETTSTYSDALFVRGLLQGRNGNLYGVAMSGGANNAGTVFKLTMTPIIASFSPTSGPVGTSVILTGANFTEATSVKVGAVKASFSVQSDTSLTLTVPVGAKSAKITVINPYGQGSGGKAFKVTP